ncbi:MAG: hypothetical protein ACI3ZN_08970 [Candidatus Cryptobacteroides sp.]
MKYKAMLFSAVAFISAVSCSGNIDPNDSGYDDGVITPPYTISVDKAVIEADGVDCATFKVTDAKGHDLTDEDNLGYLYFMDVATEKRLDRRSVSFSAFSDGEYEFVGIYRGVNTENTVKIKAQNRAKYELYHKNVAIYDITSVNCVNCPAMVKALEELPEEQKEHSIVLACHSYFQGNDPFALPVGSSDLGNTLLARFGGTGYPSAIFSLDELQSGAASSSLIANINKQRLEHPATIGIKISNSYDKTAGELTINANAKASASGTYQFGYAVMADNVSYPEGYAVDGIYNDVVIGCSSTILGFFDESKLTDEASKLLIPKNLKEGEEMSQTFKLTINLNSGSSAFANSSYKVAVFVVKNVGTSYYMDNIAVCPLNGNVDYKYN